MKLSWPPGWGQRTRMPLQPNLTSAWTPCVSSIRSDSSRCFWGREGGTRVPWWLTRGWRFGKSTLTFDVGPSGVDSHCAPPTLSEACLWLVDLSNDLRTLSMSVMFRLFGVFDFEQWRDLQLNTNIRFVSARDKKDTDEISAFDVTVQLLSGHCRGGNWCSCLTWC